MIKRTTCLLAFGCVLGRSAPAQTLDYKQAVELSRPVSTAVSEIATWITTVKLTELKIQYDEGDNLAFWIEESDLNASRVDSALQMFVTRPRLSQLVDLVIETHQLREATLNLTEALSDCHSCDPASGKRAASWAVKNRNPHRELSRALGRLEGEMSGLLVRAETILEHPPTQPLKN